MTKRESIMLAIVEEVLHSGLSIDTQVDQDYVCEVIRKRIEEELFLKKDYKKEHTMKAVIKLEVPEWAIGQDATIYLSGSLITDSLITHGICEAVKERERAEKLLPCTCGCKRREHHWIGTRDDNRYVLRCYKCGKEASGKTEIEVHKLWNKMIKTERKS